MIQRPGVASLSLILSFCLCLPVPAASQDPSQAESTFTSNIELVLVPVEVLDHMGQPLRGLKQQNFVVSSDDKPQKIGLFQEMQRQPAPARAGDLLRISASTPDNVFSNVPANGLPNESLVLAVDLVNTSPYLQNWTISQIVKYLHKTPPQVPTAVVAITGVGLLEFQSFTTDTSLLIAAVQRIGPHTGPADFGHAPALHISFTRPGTYASTMAEIAETYGRSFTYAMNAVYASLRGFDEIAWAYAGVPGRKTVAWFTSGFPVLEQYADAPPLFGKAGPPVLSPSTSRHHFGKNLAPIFQQTFSSLNRSNVVLYPVDVAAFPEDRQWDIWGSLVGGYSCGTPLPSFPGAVNNWRDCLSGGGGWLDRIGEKEVASATGGKHCDAGNHINNCVNAAVAESTDYYLLGFYVPRDKRQIGWHELKVNVNVDHGEVRARAGYLLQPTGAFSAFERGQNMDHAINAAVEYTGFAFKVEPGTRAAGSNAPIVFKVTVPATSIVLMPGEEKLSFDIIAVPLSDRGAPLHDTARIVSLDISPPRMQTALVKGWHLLDSIDSNNRIAAVKVLIRDNATGKIGSVVFPVPGAATL